jgi:hypothetical protein
MRWGVIAMFVTASTSGWATWRPARWWCGIAIQETPLWGESGSRTFTAQIFAPSAPIPEPHTPHAAGHRHCQALGADLEVLEGFFARRLDMSLPTRQALAERIASAIQAKSGLEQPAGASVETFLEATARQLRDHGADASRGSRTPACFP